MMLILIKIRFVLFLLLSTNVFSQVEKTIYNSADIKPKKQLTYTRFEISIPFRQNDTYGEYNNLGERSDYWFLPDGAGVTFGYGIHYRQRLCISANTGIIFVGTQKLVAIPIYALARITPIKTEETNFYIEFGYGKSLALGRGRLNNYFKKLALGIENGDGVSIFGFVEGHGYKTVQINNEIYYLGLGLCLTSF
jgi:hypothetical protein